MENKILIFRTSITRKCDIKRIEKLLAQYPQIDKWNVDFEDWEKILRRRCVKMRTFFFLSTKPRLSQAGALLLPKDFVSLGIRFSL